MEITEGKIKGTYVIDLKPHGDHRGFFMRTYDQQIFTNFGIDRPWVQENHSLSEHANVVRGLHFQLPPFAETKMVRCIQGRVLDVFVDIRKGSPTYGQWDAVEISALNKRMVYIPKGFAHGFATLEAGSEVVYKVDNYYSPENERGLLWNDPALAIKWPVEKPILSDKDQKNLSLAEFTEEYGGIDLTD